MADINRAFEATIKPYEGFYSYTPGDSGGETIYGYARNKNSAAPLWPLVDAYKHKPDFPNNMRNDHAILNMVISLYKLNYWDKLLLDKVNDQRIANELFDICVNCGPSTAVRFLQRALNVFNHNAHDYGDITVDGIAGHATIATLNAYGIPDKILKALNALQGARYIALCEANKTFENFMNGWISRVTC